MRAPSRPVFLVVSLLLPLPTRADPPPSDGACLAWTKRLEKASPPAVVYDHSRGLGFVWTEGRCTPLENDGAVRVNGRLPVHVVGTYGSLYSYSLKADKVEAPELKDVKTFTKALSPYFADLAVRVFGRTEALPATTPKGAGNAWDQDVRAIRELVTQGLERTTTRIEAFLEASRGTEAAPPAPAAGEDVPGRIGKVVETLENNRKALESGAVLEEAADPPPDSVCASIASGNGGGTFARRGNDFSLLTIPCLIRSYEGLGNALAGVDPLPVEVQKVLDARARIMKLAYDVEALGQQALKAKAVQTLPAPVSVTMMTGRSVTLKVAPAPVEELARVASWGPKEFRFNARPDWLVRPSAALSFVAAPQATYPKYGTAKAGDAVKVVESGTQDSRFTWGLTLGVTWRPVDGRDGSGFAWWLPELTVNPSSDLKAVGVGTAVSYGILKLGAGALWTKHTSLDGQSVDQLLPDASNLRTQDGYGPPRLYFCLSIFGWPPFEP